MRSKQGAWALVFFILIGLVGLALIGLGSWILVEPARFAQSSQKQAIRAFTNPTRDSGLVIITATPESIPTAFLATAALVISAQPQPTIPAPIVPVVTTAISATATLTTWNACAGTYPSQLRIGNRSMVSLNPPLSNNVRDQPLKTAKFLFAIPPGEIVDIIDGPGCSGNWVWWLIRTANVRTGWTAEGDGTDYWLIPAP